jgi:hypothetical protein
MDMVLLRGVPSTPLDWALVVFIVAIVFGAFALQRVLDRRRQRAFEAYCPARGYEYEPKRSDVEGIYASFVDVFGQGYDHEWRHVISGQFNGHSFTTFEYRFTTGSGKSRYTHHVAMIHWSKEAAALPQFTLAPETFFDRIGNQLFRVQTVDFPEDAAFAKTCVVKGSDPAAVQALFSPAVRAAFTPNRGQHLAGAGMDLFWWKEGDLPGPDQFDAYLTELDGVRNLFF